MRSYRGLLTHLHTCAKVPRGKTKSTEPVPTLPAAGTIPNMTSVVIDQKPPQLNSVSKSQDLHFQIPNPDRSLPTVVPQTDSAAPGVELLCPPYLSNQDSLPAQLAPDKLVEDAQLQLRNKTSKLSLSLSLAGQAALNPPCTQIQHQTQTRSPASAPNSPTGSTAVWKKNQGKEWLIRLWRILHLLFYFMRIDSIELIEKRTKCFCPKFSAVPSENALFVLCYHSHSVYHTKCRMLQI